MQHLSLIGCDVTANHDQSRWASHFKYRNKFASLSSTYPTTHRRKRAKRSSKQSRSSPHSSSQIIAAIISMFSVGTSTSTRLQNVTFNQLYPTRRLDATVLSLLTDRWTTNDQLTADSNIQEILGDLERNWLLSMLAMGLKYDFEKSFQIVIPDSESWRGGIRAGVFDSWGWLHLSNSLGKCTTLFQTELTALQHCTWNILDRGIRKTTITICSDIQAALKTISSTEVNSKLLWVCLVALL